MNHGVKVSRKQVANIIRATFPLYRGRKICLIPRASHDIHPLSMNWSGGTRYSYAACSLSGVATGNLFKHHMTAPWQKPTKVDTVPIPRGHCIVEHIMFCGKDLGLRIYLNPEDMPRQLAQAAA